jgi:hypothetical protein
MVESAVKISFPKLWRYVNLYPMVLTLCLAFHALDEWQIEIGIAIAIEIKR